MTAAIVFAALVVVIDTAIVWGVPHSYDYHTEVKNLQSKHGTGGRRMSRAIDADALEELFREVIFSIANRPEMSGTMNHMVRASAMVIEMIHDAPTIIPEPKRGRWLSDNRPGGGFWVCSCCKFPSEAFIEQSPYDTDYNPPNYIWTDNTGEVIRCEECVHANLDELSALSPRCMVHDRTIDRYDYCSWAERKKS